MSGLTWKGKFGMTGLGAAMSTLMNGSTKATNIDAAPGKRVRLRMINAANETET